MNLSLFVDRHLYGPQGGERYVWLRIEAPQTETRADRAPLDIGLVIDRSGSMSGDKIRLAKKAAAGAVDVLRQTDACALVVYDYAVDVLAPRGFVDAAQRERLRRAMTMFDARGNTDLFGGWMRGAEQVSGGEAGRIRRVLLLTDGLANHGLIDHAEILRHVRELAARGVGTTTFGVGRDFDEVLLAGMADAGAGHFYYIEQAQQIPDFLSSELGELLTVTAQNVTLRLHVEGATADNLNDLIFTDGAWSVGDLSSGSETHIVFALQTGAAEATHIKAELTWTDPATGAARSAEATVALRRGSEIEAADEAPHLDTLRHALDARRARTHDHALRYNRERDYSSARMRVSSEEAALRALARHLPEAQEELSQLEGLTARMSADIDPLERKAMWFRAQSARKSRPMEPRK